MRHLLEQFPLFTEVRASYETVGVQEGRVPTCDTGEAKIGFSESACSYDGDDMLFLKPAYTFPFKASSKTKVCTISHDDATGVASYTSSELIFTKPKEGTVQWTTCKYKVKDPAGDWLQYVPNVFNYVWYAVPTVTKYRKIQFYDYRLSGQQKPCPDSVTRPCFDNAFAFFGKVCAWVHASKPDGVSLQDLLRDYAESATASLLAYGKGRFVMDLAGKNVDVSVSLLGRKVSWDGSAVEGRLDARVHVVEKAHFSCSGCDRHGFVPDGRPVCGVPQKCVACGAWQRVEAPGTWSACDEPFAIRRCSACADHQVRSADDETACVACEQVDALRPMRRAGMLECSACAIAQWFDGASAAGCVDLLSVAQGLKVSAGAVSFSEAYVDQYVAAGMRRPEALPARRYRNIVAGWTWAESTVAEKCAPSVLMAADAAMAGAVQISFRRWCGAAEMVKYSNARMRLLASSAPNAAGFLGTTFSLSDVSAQAAKQGGSVQYARRIVGSAVAEVAVVIGGTRNEYEVVREGYPEQCRSCAGVWYTQDCGPTYLPELDEPAQAGEGRCAECQQQCSDVESFFAVSSYSCWSNGTARVSNGSAHGSLRSIAERLSKSKTYWYKPAACLPCPRLSGESVPKIVTRCGNKAWFEVWHPTLTSAERGAAASPRPRFCCALKSSVAVSSPATDDARLDTRCVDNRNEVESVLMRQAGPMCESVVPDMATEYEAFCPEGWFLDRKAAGCAGTLAAWKPECCSLCFDCRAGGRMKTDKYRRCPGDTDFDTQLQNCVTTCAERNYEVNGTCLACESCA